MTLRASLLLTSFLAACGSSSSVDIVGKEPAAQAEDIASAICEQEVDCGDVDYDCTSDGTTMTCTGTIKPVNYDACYADTKPDVLEDLSACNLTEAQERELQSCLNAMLDQPCITQSELDAYLAKLNAGEDPPDLRPEPPECAGLEAIFDSCN